MAGKAFLVFVVDENRTPVRQIHFSRRAIAGGLLVIALAVSIAAEVLVHIQRPVHMARLSRENAQLKSQLLSVDDMLAVLDSTLDDLARQDEQFRLMAGLEPLGGEVHHTAFAGPDTRRVNRSMLWQLEGSPPELAGRTAFDINTLLHRARLLSTSWTEARDSVKFNYERLAALPSIQPTDGAVTSAFTRLRWHPILDRPRAHEGVDITAPTGTPIVAAANGRVSFVGPNGDYGLMVEIDHGFGHVTRYAHASRTLVRLGQRVARGERIALVGQTGLAVGPHLHYEVLVNGRPMNPRNYVLSVNAIAD